MSHTVRVIVPHDEQSGLVFPDRCVCCGAAKQTESTLIINRLVARGRKQKQVTLTYKIPHCRRCARTTQSVFLAGFIPFGLGFLIGGGLVFIGVAFGASVLGLDDYGRPNNTNSLVLGAAAGLLAGLIGAFLFELAGRLLLLPIFGRALWQAPLLATQLLKDSDYVAGVTAAPDQEARQLTLTFANNDIAREFTALNAASLAAPP